MSNIQINPEGIATDLNARIAEGQPTQIINYHSFGIPGFDLPGLVRPLLLESIDPINLLKVNLAELSARPTRISSFELYKRAHLIATAACAEYQANPKGYILVHGFEHFLASNRETLWVITERNLVQPIFRQAGSLGARLICFIPTQQSLRYHQGDVLKNSQTVGISPEIRPDSEIDQIIGGIPELKQKLSSRYPNRIRNWAKAAMHSAAVFVRHYNLGSLSKLINERDPQAAGLTGDELSNYIKLQTLKFLSKFLSYREMDINTLTRTLKNMGMDVHDWTGIPILRTVLLQTGFLTFDSVKRAYVPNKSIRSIFSNQFLKHGLGIDDAEERIAYYSELISKVPGNRNTYIIEYFYHLCESRKSNEKIISEFDQIVDQPGYFRDSARSYIAIDGHESLNELRARIEADPDIPENLKIEFYKKIREVIDSKVE